SGRKSFGFDAVTEKLFGKIPKYERTFLNSRSLPSLPNSDSVRQARACLSSAAKRGNEPAAISLPLTGSYSSTATRQPLV
ncbi:MAG: hypothetical protein AAF958_10420, partial [Planctomycetota bacterium]